MEPQRIQIDLKGIQRNISPIGAPAGSCKDIVNLRPKDGGWRPVLPKSILYEVNVTVSGRLFAHNALPANEYLYMYRSGSNEMIVHVEKTGASTWNQIKNLVVYPFATVEFRDLICINNMIIISTTEETTFHLYKDGQYEINMSLDDLPDIRIAAGNHDQHDFGPPLNSAGTWAESLADYLEYKKEQSEDQKRYNDTIAIIAVYRMTDGTILKCSQPILHMAGPVTSHSDNIVMTHNVLAGTYVITGLTVSKVKYYIEEYIHEQWKHVIKSIDVFAGKIPFVAEPDLQSDFDEVSITFPKKDIDNEFADITFHRIGSFDLSDMQVSLDNKVIASISEDVDLSNLYAKEAFVAKQVYNHQFGFGLSKLYNGRIHLAEFTTLLFPGHRLNLQHLQWYQDNNDYLIRKSLIAFHPTFYGDGSHYEVVSAAGNYLVFRVWIDTGFEEKEVAIRMPNDSELYEIVTSAVSETKVILFNKLIAYPHPGAKRFDITLYDSGTPSKVTQVYAGSFRTHNMYPFAYHIMKSSVEETETTQICFDKIKDPSYHSAEVSMKANFMKGRTLSIDFNYTISAEVETLGITQAASATTELYISINGGQSWSTVDSITASIPGSVEDEHDFKDKSGSHTVNNVTDVSKIKFKGFFECSSGQLLKDGTIELVISDVTADEGDAEVICENVFTNECNLDAALSCNVSGSLGEKPLAFYHGYGSDIVYDDEANQPVIDVVQSFDEPNRLQLSEVENPFVWPARNSYKIGEDKSNAIIDLAVQSSPTSEGQFGEYPLIVFATNGIYLVNQGTGDVVYSNIIPISQLKANSGVMGIDGAIIFTTKDGLFILQGRVVNELNRYLISNIVYDTEDTETPENPHGDTSGGIEFLQGATFAWDNQHKEILIVKSGEDYHYRFNPENGIFFIVSGDYDGFILRNGSYQSYKTVGYWMYLYDIDTDDESEEEIRIYFKTNPQLLTAQDFKKIQRLILYCDVQTDNYYGYFNLFVFGGNIINSTNDYGLLQENKVDAGKHPVHLITGRTPVSMRYFVFMLSGKVDKDSVIQHMEADITGVLPGRLR